MLLTNIEEKIDPDQVDVVETFRACHRSFAGGAKVVVVSIACAGAIGVVVVVVVGSRHLTLVDHKDQRRFLKNTKSR